MVRAFSPEPLEADLVDRLLADALRAPSAGNTQGAELVVLTGPDETARYWDASLPAERRSTFAWPDLPAAPVLVVVLTDAQRYAERYAEDDKGQDASAWATPYWWVDGGMVVQRLLAGVEEAGLGALFFGVFEQEAAVRTALVDSHRPRDRRRRRPRPPVALAARTLGRPAPARGPGAPRSVHDLRLT